MLDLDPGPGFVEQLQRVWEAGDAVFPLDRRLPKAEAERVIAVVSPTAVIGEDGERRSLEGGLPTQPGDAVVVATSGTTGMPKGVVHTHDSVLASAKATSEGIGADPSTDRWLACLPPAHIGGLAVITRALVTGTGLIVHSSFDPMAVDQAARDGATLVSLVTRALNQVDVNGFRKVLIGGAAQPPNRPEHVIATYGMTETGSGCVYEGWPLEGVEMRASAKAEIQLRGPMLLRCYRTADGEHSPVDNEGWFSTGDLGRVEDDGRLWVDGRAGEMIVTGGENVWPSRIERVIESHEAVAEVAVVGRPDPEWGSRVCAVIVAEAGRNPPSVEELREHVLAELPAWNAPKEVVVVEALPRTSLGKIRRSDL